MTQTPALPPGIPPDMHGMPIESTFKYLDAVGAVLGIVAVYRTPGTVDKTFRPFFKQNPHNKQWLSTFGKGYRPLYGLDRLANLPDAPVVLVEGEKCADKLQDALLSRYAVVTWPGGSNAVGNADWTPLQGRKVTIWPDNDPPGFKAAENILKIITDATLLTPPPDKPPTWDAADALAEGWTADALIKFITTPGPPPSLPTQPPARPTQTQPPSRPVRYDGDHPYALKAVEAYAADVAAAGIGCRNNKLNDAACCAGNYIASGCLSEQTARSILMDAATIAGLPEAEAHYTINSGLDAGRMYPKTIPNKPKYTGPRIDAAEFDAFDDPDKPKPSPFDTPLDLMAMVNREPPPITWMFEERMESRGGILTALGGSGKTTLLYQMAVGAITGRLAWDWKVNRTGRAMLLLTEDTAADVHRMLYGVCDGMPDEERTEVFSKIIIYPMAGLDCKLLAMDGGALVKTDAFYALESKIKSFGDVVFCGIDPALAVSDGSELEQGHQRTLGKLIDDLAVNCDCTALLVCHATKGSLNADELNSHSSRGGGAITDAARFEFSMRNMTASEAKKAGINDLAERKRHCQLVCTKANHCPPEAFVPVWLRRDEYGLLHGVHLDFGECQTIQPTDLKALDLLKALSINACCKLDAWRDECIKAGIVQSQVLNTQKQQMKRIVKRLADAGMITKGIGPGIYLPSDHHDEF